MRKDKTMKPRRQPRERPSGRHRNSQGDDVRHEEAGVPHEISD
jgi:hypothetical protein